jgi:hypothetical protein
MLGTIWMDVDSERRGKLDFDQLVLCLGLISQAQQGTMLTIIGSTLLDVGAGRSRTFLRNTRHHHCRCA